MCGLTGFVGQCEADILRINARLMADAIAHRGPDDSGEWVDVDSGIALAHRRLSILDLSPTGHQPMVSDSGRFILVFNGEIYNHLDLRRELDLAKSNGPLAEESILRDEWHGHSDTETLLAAIAFWGVELALEKCVGMFAFALWDKVDNILTLARDRMGEKPLYYGWVNDFLLFGSELKALRAHPEWQGKISRSSLAKYMQFGYVPAPHTIYEGIFKLMPGTFLQIPLVLDIAEAIQSARNLKPKKYWSSSLVSEAGVRNPYSGTEEEAAIELERLLTFSVRRQMVADVPLGAFLSGGVDSSTVVALMQVQSSRPIKTFTIGFSDQGYDESPFAEAVSKHLGTEHSTMMLSPEQAMAVIPELPIIYDEPFADSSQIPTLLVARLARQHVKVSLSGDGGDELFGGYNRHVWAESIWIKIGWMSPGVRSVMSSMLTVLPPSSWDGLFHRLSHVLPKEFQVKNPGDKLQKLALGIGASSPEEMYRRLISFWSPMSVVKGVSSEPELSEGKRIENGFTRAIMFQDMTQYLPDDILVKLDRAAMSEGLEARVPMLDQHVVEFASSLPAAMNIRNGQGKRVLRRVLEGYVPKPLLERPKMGFGIPLGEWLRGPLRDWAEELLSESRLEREGYFYVQPIREKWQEHLSGSRNWAYHLWNVLMFQAWLEAVDE